MARFSPVTNPQIPQIPKSKRHRYTDLVATAGVLSRRGIGKASTPYFVNRDVIMYNNEDEYDIFFDVSASLNT